MANEDNKKLKGKRLQFFPGECNPRTVRNCSRSARAKLGGFAN